MIKNRFDWSRCTLIVQLDSQGKKVTLGLDQNLPTIALNLVISEVECGTRMQVFLNTQTEISLEKVSCDLQYKVDRQDNLFFNGYQSWTDSQEWTIKDKMPHLSLMAKPLVKRFKFDRYGDTVVRPFSKRRGHFHGFTFASVGSDQDLLLLGSLDEKTGFSILEYFHQQGKWTFSKDIEGWTGSGEICVLDLVCLSGSSEVVYDAYFKLLDINPPRVKRATGWTSWYNHYQNISEEIIKKNLTNYVGAMKADFFQIDDGYQMAVGDWLNVDSSKFPSGMALLADQIHEYGMKAGLWLAPFVVETNSDLFRTHPEWLIRDKQGELLSAGSNWSGFYALDLELPEVKAHLRSVFDVVLNQWGYDMVKLDFLYAVCMIPRNSKSRGQLMWEAMSFVRECVGEKYILGCGVPLASCFGLVDFCRIGCDVGLDWDDRWYMRLFHRERISTRHAIGSTIGRRHLNARAFVNDPDVFMLRDTNTALTPKQKETLALTNQLFGGLLFTSDDLSNYTPKQQALYQSIMNSPKPTITSVQSKKDLVLVEVESGEQFIINLSSRSRKDKLTGRVLKPYESVRGKI